MVSGGVVHDESESQARMGSGTSLDEGVGGLGAYHIFAGVDESSGLAYPEAEDMSGSIGDDDAWAAGMVRTNAKSVNGTC